VNAEPHTHRVMIERYWNGLEKGPLMVIYGDQKVRTNLLGLRTNHPSERRIRKCVEKAIKAHDAGSLGDRYQFAVRDKVAAEYNDRLVNLPQYGDRQWGSEQIKGPVG
jgi:hypothetical protein